MAAVSYDWLAVQKEMEAKLREKPADDVKKKIIMPNPIPAGNHLAHFIRSIHWNSKGMLPSSAGSKRSYDKYNTVTRLSFQTPDDCKIPFEKSSSIFHRWKVPERFMTSLSALEIVTPGHKPNTTGDVQPAIDSVRSSSIPLTPAAVKPMSPPSSRSTREKSLPNINQITQSSRGMSKDGLQQNPSRTSSNPYDLDQTPVTGQALEKAETTCVESRQKAETTCVETRQKAETTYAETRQKNAKFDLHQLPFALRPEAVPIAEAWMKLASEHDKKVIERVLKMASKKQELENSLKKTLLPDARESVEHWITDATEDERQVALNFFNSLAGSQLMGMSMESQRKRLNDVLKSLENAKPGTVSKGYIKGKNLKLKRSISDGKLRYIRMQTPDTRENQMMHTTWHHLPTNRNGSEVKNWSSHYIRPHETISRHFVIHPEWK